jgi:hypothetical protein
MKPARDLLREHVEELVEFFALHDVEGNPIRESIYKIELEWIEQCEKIIAALDVAIAEGNDHE